RAKKSLEALRAHEAGVRIGFFGHTHRAIVWRLGPDGVLESIRESRVTLDGASTYLINPGSVGQPRDGDSRASFALFDDDTCELAIERVPFDCARVRARAIELGLIETESRMERAANRISDWIDYGKAAVKRRLA